MIFRERNNREKVISRERNSIKIVLKEKLGLKKKKKKGVSKLNSSV